MDLAQHRVTSIITCVVVSVVFHLALFSSYGVYVTYLKEEEEPEEKKEIVHIPSVDSKEKLIGKVDQSPPVEKFFDKPLAETVDINDSTARKALIERQLEALRKEEEKKLPNTVVKLPRKRLYATRTKASQVTGEVPEEPDFEGMHDTVEQTTAKVNPDGIDKLASQADKPKDDAIDLFESSFEEGEDKVSGKRAKPELNAGSPDSEDISDLLKEFNRTHQLENKGEELAASASGNPSADRQNKDAKTEIEKKINRIDRSETLETDKKIAASRSQAEQQALKEKYGKTDGTGDIDKKASESKSANTPSNLVSNQKPVNRGKKITPPVDPFAKAISKSEVRKNDVDGSIGKQGVTTSRNVKASESGKYKSQILRKFEIVYQKLFIERRNNIAYGGVAFVTIQVDASGELVNRVIVATDDTQKEFSLLVLQETELPRMNEKLRKSQEGVPIEMKFNIKF